MTEIVYDAAPDLRRPSQFFRHAVDDLRRSRAAAWQLSGTGASGFLATTIGSTAALLVPWLFHRLPRPHVLSRLG